MEWISAQVCAAASHTGPDEREVAAGFLLGSRTRIDDESALVIEGAEPLEEKTDLDVQLRWLAAEGAVVLGVYRVEARERSVPEFRLEDAEVLNHLPGDAISVVVAADPALGGQPQASACAKVGDRCSPWSAPAPFPFGGPESGKLEPSTVRPLAKRSWVPVYLGFAVLAAAVALWLTFARVGAATHQGIELSAERIGDQWSLKWNPESPAFVGAAAAYVLIVDGPAKTRYVLTREQIGAGSVVYSPTSGSVAFSVEAVSESGQSTRETLIAVHPGSKQKEQGRTTPPRRRI
jgi:hypothetical protein